jgi:hypothetical protein
MRLLQKENQALADAMNGLSVLRYEVASWSLHKITSERERA